VKCSKGTYIRSLANDFGNKLSVGGTLIELRRTASGNFSIEDAKSVDDWLSIIEEVEQNSEVQ
jgi:tRNA pseudouridine55 synthase